MAIVVVGGSGRGVGKTALVCGLIAALPGFNWIAVKVTSHAYGLKQSIREENAAGEGTDTARYLAAGARRAILLSASGNAEMQAVLDQFWKALPLESNCIFESNRLFDFLKPDLCLMIDGGAEAKASFASALEHADAIVVKQLADEPPVSQRSFEIEKHPVFRPAHFERLPTEMIGWIRGRLIYR